MHTSTGASIEADMCLQFLSCTFFAPSPQSEKLQPHERCPWGPQSSDEIDSGRACCLLRGGEGAVLLRGGKDATQKQLHDLCAEL
eukprot:3787820-Pleurochrysis_carterae.AAC.1